jgi:Phosphotransferase enzyme family
VAPHERSGRFRRNHPRLAHHRPARSRGHLPRPGHVPGDLCARYLSAVSVSMYTQSPRTLIHHDVQGDNLLVAGDGEPSLAFVDWQLTTAARPVVDLADFLVRHLDTSERRRDEDRLLGIYHSVLTERGVADHSLEQCRDDYGMALLLPASRLASAVGLHPGLTATPDGFWNVVFPRYARALTDLGVSELPSAALRLVEGLLKRP